VNRPIDNQRVIEIKALPSPRTIKTKLPIMDQAAALLCACAGCGIEAMLRR